MRTLVELLMYAAARWRDDPAVSLYGTRPFSWTYGQLDETARRIAAWLSSGGVDRGDRVILWGPNGPEWVAAFFGVQLAGGIAVPLDARSREQLLADIEHQTQPKRIIIGREQLAILGGQHAPCTLLEELRSCPTGEPGTSATGADQPLPQDTAELVFTSGTTDTPKGVILTHGNITSNVRMAYQAVVPSPKHRVLSVLPLSHMFEQTTGLFAPLSGGSSITYVSRLRPELVFGALRGKRCTNMSCVPQVLQLFRDGVEREVRRQKRARQFERLHALAGHLPFGLRRLLFRPVHQQLGGAFDFLVVGGARLEPELARWWERLGIKVLQGYGMTEASPIVACHSLNARDPESVGRPVPGLEVRISEDGEIQVRGDSITPGYWQDQAATAEVFQDGWYRTGDLGRFDRAGRLHLIGRKRNMIVLPNGMNVYPEDVEHALAADQRVRASMVFAEQRGGDIHAVLLLDRAADASDVVRRTNARLAPHQHIRRYTVWPDETFPLTSTLKVKRREVEERVAVLHARR